MVGSRCMHAKAGCASNRQQRRRLAALTDGGGAADRHVADGRPALGCVSAAGGESVSTPEERAARTGAWQRKSALGGAAGGGGNWAAAAALQLAWRHHIDPGGLQGQGALLQQGQGGGAAARGSSIFDGLQRAADHPETMPVALQMSAAVADACGETCGGQIRGALLSLLWSSSEPSRSALLRCVSARLHFCARAPRSSTLPTRNQLETPTPGCGWLATSSQWRPWWQVAPWPRPGRRPGRRA